MIFKRSRKKQLMLGEMSSVWCAQHHAKMRAVFLTVLWAPSPLFSVLRGVHPSLPPGLLHSLPRRWTLAGACGTHHQPWPHHGYRHLPPPAAGPGECVEIRPLEQAAWGSGPVNCLTGDVSEVQPFTQKIPKPCGFEGS